MTLYLKYRPVNVDELDITEVRESLGNIISSGKVPHALLFSGPRGTGKTSAARILSKALNCESPQKNGEACNKCSHCRSIQNGENLDVIEIDAASHRGIDDIRSIKDSLKLSPVSSKFKVYIVDEAHMLTSEASNALLKTLEEPPSHVVFILATTNPEKLIDTIKSRVTKVDFRKATTEEILRSLKRVSEGEKLEVEMEGLEKIAIFSDGSFRDAVKLLEELSLKDTKIPTSVINDKLLNKTYFDIDDFFQMLGKRDAKGLIKIIEGASSKGIPSKNVMRAILENLKESLLSKTLEDKKDKLDFLTKDEVIDLLQLFSESSLSYLNTVVDQLSLEIAIIKWCGSNQNENSKVVKPTGSNGSGTKSEGNENSGHSDNVFTDSSTKITSQSSDFTEPGFWLEIMTKIKPINASTEALLRASKPMDFDGKTLTLGVYYKFHKEKLEGLPHRKILEDLLNEILGGPIRISCTLTEQPVKKIDPESTTGPTLTEASDTDIMKVAEEIFGN